MKENFDLLLDRVIDTLNKSDLLKIKEQLDSINGNTIITGVGESRVVTEFASKTLNNNFINICKSARDFNYEKIDLYKNIFIISYSGKGYVVDNALKQNKNIFLLTNNDTNYNDVNTIKYNSSIKKENSFISLASTLMPMTILFYYYKKISKDELINLINDMFNKVLNDIKDCKLKVGNNDIYEILGGNENSSAIAYLDSTMAESAIALPIIHEKFDYCHGRSTTSFNHTNGLIYFDNSKELDEILLSNLNKYYTEIINIEKYNENTIDNDYYATIKSMFITYLLAQNKHVDLSDVLYSPIVKKLYYFKGEM